MLETPIGSEKQTNLIKKILATNTLLKIIGILSYQYDTVQTPLTFSISLNDKFLVSIISKR